MVARKSSTGTSKKLKVKKETLKDLDASRRGVKGGGVAVNSAGAVCRQPQTGQDGTTQMPGMGTVGPCVVIPTR